MAGEDYSGVQESQSPRRPSLTGSVYQHYVAELKNEYAKIKPNWRIINDKQLPSGNWVYLPQTIYYDTEGFHEFRHDRIRMCEECGGTFMTESMRDDQRLKSILVRIPFGACQACEQAGYDLWESSIGRCQSALLQNQKSGQVQFWHIDQGVKIFEVHSNT